MAAYVTRPRRWTSNPTTTGDFPTGHRDHVITKLLGVCCRHIDILPAGTSRPHKSGVNQTFSSVNGQRDFLVCGQVASLSADR